MLLLQDTYQFFQQATLNLPVLSTKKQLVDYLQGETMVALTDLTRPVKTSHRLTTQTAEISAETIAIRSLDWDRDRFDVEFSLENGTTYNSFIIQAEKTALIDTSHIKFRQLYLDILVGLVDPAKIDYLIISHTEPDHSGLVREVLELAKDIIVVGSKVAIQFLENMVHHPFNRQIVRNDDRLDLGSGHELTFVSAPNLHWPDTIFTYDAKTQILFTCDAFGMHYCDDHTFDEDLELLEAEFQYYYDCLMRPNTRSVLAALKRMEKLSSIQMIATGHGPLLHHNMAELVERYRTWSQPKTNAKTAVALFYVEDYGFSERLINEIAQGILKTDVGVELVDLASAEIQEVREIVSAAAGLVIAMPSQSGKFAATTSAAINTILATAHRKQAIGLVESGGGDDESLDTLQKNFVELGLTEVFPPLAMKGAPTEATEQWCNEAGTDMGQWLMRDRTIKQMKTLDSKLDKALGRMSGGLYIITACKGDASSGMLASWVLPASLEPLGVATAIAKQRAIESFMHNGDHFVLNILEDGNCQELTKHFLKRFPPGADRFVGVKTYPASNGSLILAEALAYLECQVTSRMECSDHWVIYSTVQSGKISKPNASTAVHHRKVGNHYMMR